MPNRHLVVLSWSGMRGALSLAGALSIPLIAGSHAFPARDQVIFLVYCVVLGTLIIPSLTLKTLVRRLGLGQGERLREQKIRARIRVAHAALSQLEEIADEHRVPEDVLSRLRGVCELRISRLESGRHDEGSGEDRREGAGMQEVRDRLVDAQRRALGEIRSERTAAAEVLQRIQRDVDLDAARLRSGA